MAMESGFRDDECAVLRGSPGEGICCEPRDANDSDDVSGVGAEGIVTADVVESTLRETCSFEESRVGKDVQFGPLDVEAGDSFIFRLFEVESAVIVFVALLDTVVGLERMIGVCVAAD